MLRPHRFPLPRSLPRASNGSLLTSSFSRLALLLALAASAALAGCGSVSAPLNTAATATTGAAIGQRIDTLARQAAADISNQVQTAYDAGQGDATVTVTVAWTDEIHSTDVAKEQDRVKTICFQEQQTLWTASLPVRQVTVTVLGPVTTGYGEQYNDAHGAARLTSGTAKSFNWGTLTPDSAWTRYDEVYLRSDYEPPVAAQPIGPQA